MDIRCVVVEDHELVGAALCRTLGDVDGVDVVGMATSVAGAVELLGRHRPDVALLDLRLGADLVVDHLAALIAASPASRVIVLTGWPTEHGLDRAFAAGAAGFLSKCQPLAELVDGIRRAHDGELVVCPELVPALVRRAVDRQVIHLEDREIEVLALLVDARSTQEIAATLCISEHTVQNRIGSSMAKLGARSRVEAVQEAVRRGVVLPVEPTFALRPVSAS